MDEHEAVSRHDGVAAIVAVAASGASVTGSAANVDIDAPADFFHWEALRKTELFQKLFHQVLLFLQNQYSPPDLKIFLQLSIAN